MTTLLGRAAYDAYGDSRKWTTANGGSMTKWDDQRDDLKAAWCAAGEAAVRAYVPGVCADIDRARGAVLLLAFDGVITGSRARELLGMTVEEVRAAARDAIAKDTP